MILVLVGTNPYSFERLVRAMDDYAGQSSEQVFIQLGHTPYLPVHADYSRFLCKEDVLRKIREAELVVTQGGFGSIADACLEGKPVVAVPRRPELGEAPDRQEEVVRELERVGKVVAVYDVETLPLAIEAARRKEAPPREGHRIPGLINRFIAGS